MPAGRERMLCGYVKIKAPMTVYRRGIAVWNDETNVFDRVSDFEPDVPLYPDGHTFRHRDGDREYVYFSTCRAAGARAGHGRSVSGPGAVRGVSPA